MKYKYVVYATAIMQFSPLEIVAKDKREARVIAERLLPKGKIDTTRFNFGVSLKGKASKGYTIPSYFHNRKILKALRSRCDGILRLPID